MSDSLIAKLGHRIADDALSLILGEFLGSGQYRDVYVLATNKNFVVKVERDPRTFCNVAEWDMWTNLQGTKLERWCCPCSDISDSGTLLIMHRAKPISATPARVPSVFVDCKAENWGLYKGRPVCIDYGNHGLFTLARKHARLGKARV